MFQRFIEYLEYGKEYHIEKYTSFKEYCILIVAKDATDREIGYAGYHSYDEGTAFTDSQAILQCCYRNYGIEIYDMKKWAGKGLGKKLLTYAINSAKDESYDTLLITDILPEAEGFYLTVLDEMKEEDILEFDYDKKERYIRIEL